MTKDEALSAKHEGATTVALKLALEALEYIEHNYMSLPAPAEKAIAAIRDALAQPEHSCAACEGNPKGNNNPCAVCGLAQPKSADNGGKTGWPPGLLQDDHSGLSRWLASKPDARQKVREALASPVATNDTSQERVDETAKQRHEPEPLAWFRYETVYEYKNQLARCTKDCIGAFPVYTTPQPQREWVGLTDEEVITMSRYDLEYAALIGEVERKLKEKNT